MRPFGAAAERLSAITGDIAQDFRADYALVSLSLAGYAVVAVALELIMGPLSDRFGRRPIVMVSVATFTIVSIGRAPMPARSRRGRTWLEAQPGWQAL